MTIPNRMLGYGTTLGFCSTVNGTYTYFTGLKNVTPPKAKAADIKNSDLSNTTQTHTYQPGWLDGDKMSLTLYFDKAQYTTVLGYLTGRTLGFWKVLFPKQTGESTSGSFFTVSGYVNEVGFDEISIDDENMVMVPIAIKCTDVPTFTSGS